MNHSIEIKHVSVVVGKGFKAVNDVSVILPAQRIIGFIGPSGAGKTSLLRAIVGRQRIARGEMRIFGLAAGSRQLRHDVTYMTQGLSVYADLSVRENIRYFARMAGVNRRQLAATVERILTEVALTDRADILVGDLSGGQKQRVSLGIALIGSPKLMVLDEPTVGLDPVLREQLWALLRKMADKGTTIIVSSHVMDEAARCDDLLLIRDGKLLAHDTPDKLCARTHSATVEQAFIALVGAEK